MIDNAKINVTAIKLINDTLGCIYEYCDKENDNTRLVTLGEVSGICALAEKLTEELTKEVTEDE